MNYINTVKRCLVNSVNQVLTSKLDFDYAVTDQFAFTLMDKQGKILTPSNTDLYYLAGDTNCLLSDTPIFLSTTYTIEGNVITFSVDTYTAEYLSKITAPDSSIWLEIGRKTTSDSTYKVVLKCLATAQPRVYVPGLPVPYVMDAYYTADDVDTLLSGYYPKTSIDTLLSGFYSKTAIDTLLGGKLEKVTNGTGRKYAGNNGSYNYVGNTGIDYALAVSGTNIAFSPEQTIYSITPTSGNVYTFDTTLIPSDTVWTCELWVVQSSPVTFTLPTISWIDGSVPDFTASGTVWLVLRYASGTWYGNVQKGA